MSKAPTRAQRDAALRLDLKRLKLALDVFDKGPDYRWGACGSDDYDPPNGLFTKAEWSALVLDLHTWNGDPEDAKPENYMPPGWSFLFGYIRAALLKHASATLSAHAPA